MRSEGGNCLNVDAGDNAGGRNDDVDRWVALQAVTPCKAIVVPGDDDRRGPLGQRRGLADNRNEVACLVEFGEVGKARCAGLGCIFFTR
jgi:hypothetical protein